MRQPGKEFNEQRKVFRKGIGAQSVTRYNSLVKGEAERFIQKISGFAGDPMPSIERCILLSTFLSLPVPPKLRVTVSLLDFRSNFT